MDNLAPKDLMSSIMKSMEKLHCSTTPTYSRTSRPPKSSGVEIWPIRGTILNSPRSPTRPKGSRNIPVRQITEAKNDPNSKRPRAPSRFLMPKPKQAAKKPATSSNDDVPTATAAKTVKTRGTTKFRASTANRKITDPKQPTSQKRLFSSSSEDDETKKRMDDSIKSQTLKFQPAEKKK